MCESLKLPAEPQNIRFRDGKIPNTHPDPIPSPGGGASSASTHVGGAHATPAGQTPSFIPALVALAYATGVLAACQAADTPLSVERCRDLASMGYDALEKASPKHSEAYAALDREQREKARRIGDLKAHRDVAGPLPCDDAECDLCRGVIR